MFGRTESKEERRARAMQYYKDGKQPYHEGLLQHWLRRATGYSLSYPISGFFWGLLFGSGLKHQIVPLIVLGALGIVLTIAGIFAETRYKVHASNVEFAEAVDGLAHYYDRSVEQVISRHIDQFPVR